MNARIDLSLSRREFLKASGALVVSAAGPAFIGEALAQAAAGSAGGKPPLVPTELDSWVAIAPDGRVTAFFGKMDMGQSLDIAIAQIVADELDVDVAKVDVIMGDTALTCNQGGASGSTGIQTGARPLRSAAAEARRLLMQSASQKLGLPVEQDGAGIRPCRVDHRSARQHDRHRFEAHDRFSSRARGARRPGGRSRR